MKYPTKQVKKNSDKVAKKQTAFLASKQDAFIYTMDKSTLGATLYTLKPHFLLFSDHDPQFVTNLCRILCTMTHIQRSPLYIFTI